MVKIRITEDMDECRLLWNRLWPQQSLFDLWEVRTAFSESYNRSNFFHIAEENGKYEGLLALSWIPEQQVFMNFPGETWQKKTWLEQNRITASGPAITGKLIASVAGTTRLSYVGNIFGLPDSVHVSPDENGYLFYPWEYGFSFDNYLNTIPGKTRRKLLGEVRKFESMGVSIVYDNLSDLEFLYRMNMESFREYSYFNEPAFLIGFEKMIAWLYDQRMLKTVSVMIGGELAAVDVGAVFNNHCTMLAGGTNPEFNGVAKLINLHHIKTACHEKYHSLDFLCGDFNWKERFRLKRRPFYELTFGGYPGVLSMEGMVANAC